MGNKVLVGGLLRSVQTAVKVEHSQGLCLLPTSLRLLQGLPAASSRFRRGTWKEPHLNHFTSDQSGTDSSTCRNQRTPDPAV